MHCVSRLRQAVVREFPLARRRDEAHAPQVGEVPRDGRLREREDLDDVADAELPRGEHAEDADARRVGEALEDRVEVVDGRGGDGGCQKRSGSYLPGQV